MKENTENEDAENELEDELLPLKVYPCTVTENVYTLTENVLKSSESSTHKIRICEI